MSDDQNSEDDLKWFSWWDLPSVIELVVLTGRLIWAVIAGIAAWFE